MMAMFRAWVAFRVKATPSGPSRPNSSASSVRHRKAVSAARIASGCPPRPGELIEASASVMARATAGGFWKVVAALSR